MEKNMVRVFTVREDILNMREDFSMISSMARGSGDR